MLAQIKRGLWLVGIAGLLGAESDSGDSDSGGSDSDSDSGDSSGGDDGGSSDSDSALSGDERGAHEPGDGLLLYTSMHSNSDSTYSSTGEPSRRTVSKRKNDLSDDDLSEIPPQ